MLITLSNMWLNFKDDMTLLARGRVLLYRQSSLFFLFRL